MKENVIFVEPQIGMAATICHWSDRTPATVIEISRNGKRLVLQEDISIRTDTNGMSEMQSYLYKIDPHGCLYHATLRKDGRYRIAHSKQVVFLGERRKYHDYSF